MPDPQGFGYKAELTVVKTDSLLLRVNLWMGPDIRNNLKPEPHSHPGSFRSEILMGGYVEDRYEVSNGTSIDVQTLQHVAGYANDISRATFHEVTNILDPGRTLTLMISQDWNGPWGCLDVDSGVFMPNRADPEFNKRLLALNPQHR